LVTKHFQLKCKEKIMPFGFCVKSAQRDVNLFALQEHCEGSHANTRQCQAALSEARACLQAVGCIGLELAKKGAGINAAYKVGPMLQEQRRVLSAHIKFLEKVVDGVLAADEQVRFLSSDYKKSPLLREAALSGNDSVKMGALKVSVNAAIVENIQPSHQQVIDGANHVVRELNQALKAWENGKKPVPKGRR
jgi:hypothetical protein